MYNETENCAINPNKPPYRFLIFHHEFYFQFFLLVPLRLKYK